MSNNIILVRTFFGSRKPVCFIAANTIIMARQNAETGVRMGTICNNQGNIKPTAPGISDIPMKRTSGMGGQKSNDRMI